ncbi:MAG TPA: hypothetical protein VIN59_00325 [Alphaproteobacteria bacterium]
MSTETLDSNWEMATRVAEPTPSQNHEDVSTAGEAVIVGESPVLDVQALQTELSHLPKDRYRNPTFWG